MGWGNFTLLSLFPDMKGSRRTTRKMKKLKIRTIKLKGEFGMKRTVYEAPVTELFRVELEGGFMAGSVVTDQGSTVETTGHEIGDTYDFSTEQYKPTWE